MSEGLGNLCPVKLELKFTAIPKSIPPRSVPQGVREQLQKTLIKLVKQGVIWRDTGPTKWLTPNVIVNKPSDDMQICLDPPYLNSQFPLNHCMWSTTTETFSCINGSKDFSSSDAT